MSIDATQVIAPAGPLDPAPGEDSNVFAARVQIYVDAAYADARVAAETDAARKDRMAKALASYTGLMADYRRMLREPLTVSVTEKGSHGFSTAQIAGVKVLADQYLAEFEDLLPVEATSPVTNRSSAVRNQFTW